MYINWFIWIIYFDDCRCYTKQLGVYPSTFNVLVDLIVCHWAGIVEENEAIPDGFR